MWEVGECVRIPYALHRPGRSCVMQHAHAHRHVQAHAQGAATADERTRAVAATPGKPAGAKERALVLAIGMRVFEFL